MTDVPGTAADPDVVAADAAADAAADTDAAERHVAAPELREVATIWWDVERDPLVCWDAAGTCFELVDPVDPGELRLLLASFPDGVADPARVAHVLAEGLAACDFPPTEPSASPRQVARALAAAGLTQLRPAGA